MGTIQYRDRNEGKVYKNGKKKKPNWEYRFEAASVNGKRLRIEKSGFAKKQDAVEASIAAYNEYMNGGEKLTKRNVSFADCLDHWMENYVLVQCKNATYVNYEKCIRLYIKPALGSYKMNTITSASMQNMINGLAEKQFSMSVIRTVKGICNKSFKYAKRNRWIESNGALDVDMPSPNVRKKLHCKERRSLTADEIKTIFGRFPKYTNAHTTILLAYRCGLRKGEIMGLTWDDINLKDKTITISRQMQYSINMKEKYITTPKYDSNRVVDLDDDTTKYLTELKDKQDAIKNKLGKARIINFVTNNGLVNIEGDGTAMDFVLTKDTGEALSPQTACYYVKVMQKLGIKGADIHCLRHTHATELATQGVHLKEIQRRLGHKTEDVTMQKYIHASNEMRDEAKNILNSMFAASEKNSGGTSGAKKGIPSQV